MWVANLLEQKSNDNFFVNIYVFMLCYVGAGEGQVVVGDKALSVQKSALEFK